MRTLGVWCVLVLVTATTWASKARTFLPRCSFEMPVEGCSCRVTRQNSAVISCTDLGLTEVPQFSLPDGMTIEHLDLSGNDFIEIPYHGLGNRLINSLKISRTTTSANFHPECLSEAQKNNLLALDISYNGLTSFPLFIGMGSFRRLEELVLTGNTFEPFVNKNDFSGLSNLVSLELGNVLDLTSDAFHFLSNLEFLSLSPSMLGNYGDLTDYLGRKNLQTISGLKGIEVTDTSFSITPSFLENFDNLVNLEITSSGLQNSEIDQALSDQRGNSILHVSFYNNYLKLVPRHFLRSVPALEHLDLTSNSIKTIHDNAFVRNQELVSLFLRNNRIDVIEHGAFSTLHNLEELDLSDNRLAYLIYNDFPVGQLHQGMVLFAGSNPLHCDCELFWLVDLAYKQHHGGTGPLDPYELATSLQCESPGERDLMYEKYDDLAGLCIDLYMYIS